MLMRPVGFFREMNPDNLSTFREPILGDPGQGQEYDREKVVEYLRSGCPLFDVTEGTVDVIGGKFQVPGGSSVVGDGEFVWRVDLSAYVEEYSIALPADFLEFIEMNRYEVPEVSRERLLELSRQVRGMLNFRADPGAGPRRR
ncbi:MULTISPECIES: hypothetical protein [Streptomyces]|uniref:Uncharacterized protein n=1 Tax=Streptomyces ehimensis TaxID=68195 RepID=A0ABV9BQR3_9ACTN